MNSIEQIIRVSKNFDKPLEDACNSDETRA
jgi:hypothetical protein